jgi:hypothetical protein
VLSVLKPSGEDILYWDTITSPDYICANEIKLFLAFHIPFLL